MSLMDQFRPRSSDNQDRQGGSKSTDQIIAEIEKTTTFENLKPKVRQKLIDCLRAALNRPGEKIVLQDVFDSRGDLEWQEARGRILVPGGIFVILSDYGVKLVIPSSGEPFLIKILEGDLREILG